MNSTLSFDPGAYNSSSHGNSWRGSGVASKPSTFDSDMFFLCKDSEPASNSAMCFSGMEINNAEHRLASSSALKR